MQNARAHKIQWSGPTVHSFTVSSHKGYQVALGSLVQKVNNAIQRIVIFLNFLNMLSSW